MHKLPSDTTPKPRDRYRFDSRLIAPTLLMVETLEVLSSEWDDAFVFLLFIDSENTFASDWCWELMSARTGYTCPETSTETADPRISATLEFLASRLGVVI